MDELNEPVVEKIEVTEFNEDSITVKCFLNPGLPAEFVRNVNKLPRETINALLLQLLKLKA